MKNVKQTNRRGKERGKSNPKKKGKGSRAGLKTK